MEDEDSSLRKNNVSFSFTFDSGDFEDVASDNSSDSETTGLQIDVSEVEHFNETDKPKRQDVGETFFINEMEEEIERQLDAKAAKTKLTATNVKNILKHVISNEHVMAMVHKKLTKGDSDVVFEPKLTRAKAKELAMTQPDVPWPMTPMKMNKSSEAQILIEKEYGEDSSDEEYHPDQDQQSDDEKEVDSSTGNDIDSMPSTPATPGDPSLSLEMPSTPEVQYDTEEGLFKVPLNIPYVPTEDESIGHRTRSKFSLKETPVEQIEQAFIPPDITNDMYDWDCEPGDDYLDFLKELYTQPLPREANVEDDPEADPEYNILEDEDTEFLDREELREDRAVRISKRELKTLIAELDEFADMYQTKLQNEQLQQQQQQFQQEAIQHQTQQEVQQSPEFEKSKKRKTLEASFEFSQEPPPMTSHANTMIDLIPVLAEPELPKIVNPNQLYVLSIQISQHVQLLTQQFLMTYKHPRLHKVAAQSKNYLNSLKQLAWGEKSEFNAKNLNDALTLVSDWESKLSNPSFSEEYNNFVIYQLEMEETMFNKRKKYRAEFHPALIQIMASSKALMHPQLLPDVFPSAIFINEDGRNSKSDNKKSNLPYISSEEHLIALGLEQFLPHVETIKKKFNRKCDKTADAVKEIQKYLLPTRDVVGMVHHIKKRKLSKEPNPIKYYYTMKSAPPVKHCLLSEYKTIAPKDQPLEFLSTTWRIFRKNLENNCNAEMPLVQFTKATTKENNFHIVDINDIIHRKEPEIISHELRNPIVNMLHHNMPPLVTPQKDDSAASSSKSSSSVVKITPRKPSEVESDAESAESIKTCETDEEESRPTRLRMTTPRLAKIKSAQNMKLLAQTLSSKGSTSVSHSSENKEDSPDKNDDDASSFTKGDNEDEIAELMLASTTIKKNTTSRKKTKQARDLENLKRLLEAESNVNEEERATKFAASFIQKIHVKLESKDPELFKILLKIFLDYSEKVENSPEPSEDLLQSKNSPSTQNVEKNDEYRDKLSVELYQEVCDKLFEYPDLCSDFLLFLTPNQAALIDKSVEHTMMLKMKEFVNVTQMYFAKQPSRIAKVMQAITQMVSDPYITVENAQTIMGTALKGHPLIMDMFLQVIPEGKPPESLFAAHMFENLACPVGPHDKNKAFDVDAPELYENIELPASTPQEDPYGGDSCKCECHSIVDDLKLKGINEHCASCGTRFLNGRIYLQTSEGLRPAKITFPGADDEKLENISRVSLKTNEKIVPCAPEKKRRKSSKRDSISEESTVKGFPTKVSPSKENEDSDRSKSRKSTKSPTKSTDPKKLSKVPSTSVKIKREKKAEKKIKIEFKTEDDQNEYCVSGEQMELDEGNASNTNDEYAEDTFCNKLGEISTDSHEDDASTSPEKIETFSTNVKKLEVSSDSDNSTTVDTEKPYSDLPWSMHDDKILLEHVQKDYCEKTFHTVSLLLKNRTVEEVKERCQFLLSLIEKMV